MSSRKREAPLPVRGVLGGIDARRGRRGEALALHLVEELGEAVGEVEDRGAGGERRAGGGEPGAPGARARACGGARGTGGRQSSGRERVVGELGHHADARQEAGRPGGERSASARAARRVLTQISTRGDRLGRLAGEPGVEAGDERAGEVDAGRQREDPRASLRREEPGHRASSASAERDALGAADVDPAAGMDDAASRPSAISASQTGLSEKTALGEGGDRRRGR